MGALRKKFISRRIPVSGSIELTHRCNLHCVHCYLRAPDENNHVLSTDQWQKIIDQTADAGCFNLLITGGEPLLHPGFADIYRHAKERGLLVTVFTNGTLVDQTILELFGDLPPYSIEITLYGATTTTYEKITGVRGSYQKCLENIHTLKKKRFNLKLKTVLLKTNRHELKMIQAIARDLKIGFRLDPAIFPRFNGDNGPVELRVPPAEAVQLEFADSRRLQEWREFYKRMQGLPGEERLFTCGAGLTTFHIDPGGNLSACLMVRQPSHNLLTGSFSEGWHEVISRIRELKASKDYHCNHCEKRSICNLCPGFSHLEQGSFESLSPYLCSIGEKRHQYLVADAS
jgi:radical SAM protein with 4Fe4S-binding SPASM domain